MSGEKEVDPISEEFGSLEFELQVQLNAPKLVVGKCYDITNKTVNQKFENYVKTLLPLNIVDAFVPVGQLKQTVEDIKKNGIKVDPKEGFKFQVDTFEVDRKAEEVQVIHIRAALGNVINNQSSTDTSDKCDFLKKRPKASELRSNYQSICLNAKNYFLVFNSCQITTLHYITIPGGANLEEPKPGYDICDLCGKEQATIWCVNDSAQLCAKCDEESHKANKLVERHKRIPLTEARCVIEFCPVHHDQRVEYYCPKCHGPVCYTCKMTGSHGVGEAALHPLVPIRQAYGERVNASQDENAIFLKRKSAIDQKLKVTEERLQQIRQNEEEVIEEIHRIAEDAIKNVHELAGEKALFVRSTRTELQRKRKEIETHERFSNIHRYVSLPLTFIRYFDRQEIYAKGSKETTDLPEDIKVEADLCLFGTLDVSNRPANRQFAQSVTTPRPLNTDDEELTNKAKQKGKGPVFTSLIKLGKRKEEQNIENGLALTFVPFQDSSIITNHDTAKSLYLCFPFKDQPQTHLLYSTKRDERSIKRMHQLIDNIGVTALFIKKDDFVFGGFAACKWNSNGKPFGEKTSSFIFSVTHDAFIPYKPKVSDACQMIATEDTLSFGKYDIVLADNFDRCTATIENSYGIGFKAGSDEAENFLAGQPLFKADIVEVWGFWRPEDQKK